MLFDLMYNIKAQALKDSSNDTTLVERINSSIMPFDYQKNSKSFYYCFSDISDMAFFIQVK